MPSDSSDHELNFGSRPGGLLVCNMPGRYSVVECCRTSMATEPASFDDVTVSMATAGCWSWDGCGERGSASWLKLELWVSVTKRSLTPD